MADLVLDVEARGTTQAAAGLDKVSTAAAKTGSTWDAVKRKLGSGEVLRNAAASAALLGSGAGNATQKIAALGGALAAIPGPVGLVASGVAIAATVLDVFSKNAEQAEKAAAELAATLANLGKQKLDTQLALAGKISGAAVRLGGDVRANFAAGGSGKGFGQELFPGDPGSAIRLGGAVAGMSGESQQKVLATLSGAKSLGKELTQALQDSVVKTIGENADAFAPVGDEIVQAAARARDESAARGGGIFGANVAFPGVSGEAPGAGGVLRDLTGMDQQAALSAAIKRMSSDEGQTLLRGISRGEAPAVAAAGTTARDALGGGAEAAIALKLATEKETTATDTLTTAIRDLTSKLTTAGATKAPADSGWLSGMFGRSPATP